MAFNEKADGYAKTAAEGTGPDSAIADECRWETSLSHMTRVATEARSRSTTQWITSDRSEATGPPGGRALSEGPPPSAKVDHQPVLPAPIRTCGDRPLLERQYKQQTRRHLFTECRALRPQITRLWKEIGKACGWKHPKAPSVKWLWREKATEAVLDF